MEIEEERSEITVRKKMRQSNIELLRILALLMIISCHFATHGGFTFGIGKITIPHIWWNILELGGGCGTNIFMMITGYFLVKNTETTPKTNKAILLWLQVFFYSVMLFFLAFPLGYGDTSIKTILRSILPISFEAWWFASVYFVIYLLHPFINLALNAMNKNQYKGLLVLLIIMWSIIPTITTSSFQSNQLIELIMMYIIGGYISKFGFFEKFKSGKWALLWAFFTIVSIATSLGILVIGNKMTSDVIFSHSTYFYSRTNLLTIARAVCFFMTFLTLKIHNHIWIAKVSSAMFGVYLLHDSKLLRKIIWEDIFHNVSYQNTTRIIPYSIIVVLAVFISCTIIDLLRQTLLEKPIKTLIEKRLSHHSTSQ